MKTSFNHRKRGSDGFPNLLTNQWHTISAFNKGGWGGLRATALVSLCVCVFGFFLNQ